MTTTYDPFHPQYFDESDLRQELNRVYDLCHGCRLCVTFCPAFPTMFAAIDQHDDQDATRMTTAEQDRVVDECFNCKLCYVNCPYIPGQHDWELDFPRLMLRAEQVLRRTRTRPVGARVTDQALGRTDLAGKVNTALAPVVNKVVERPGSAGRKLLEKVAGIASERVLPPYARQRFSTWWRKRGPQVGTDSVTPARQGNAIVFPTCLVEYHTPQVGKDLVRVYERNGIDCTLPAGQVCCGAPWLHAGDVDHFRKQGRTNVAVLAGAIRAAQARGDVPAVVVPQPTCGYVLKHDYVDYLGGPDAELVAEHTHDASEYLMKIERGDATGLVRDFTGDVPAEVTYHAPCHLRAQNIGLQSRDLLKLAGAEVKVVAECSGVDGTWGFRRANYAASRQVGATLGQAIDRAGGDAVVGDCHLANGGIMQETGRTPQHPLSYIARAYGIPEDRSPAPTRTSAP